MFLQNVQCVQNMNLFPNSWKLIFQLFLKKPIIQEKLKNGEKSGNQKPLKAKKAKPEEFKLMTLEQIE